MASGESYGVPNQFGGARLGSGLVGRSEFNCRAQQCRSNLEQRPETSNLLRFFSSNMACLYIRIQYRVSVAGPILDGGHRLSNFSLYISIFL